MTSFVIFKTLEQLYGIDIECVKRILPSPFLTGMPDEDEHIEGMFIYEGEIIKVVSFRKLIGIKSYEEQLHQLFSQLRAEHQEWLEALQETLEEGNAFTQAMTSHSCSLGKWIDSFHPDDEALLDAMKQLSFHHQQLHQSALHLLEEKQINPQAAKKRLQSEITALHEKVFNSFESVVKMSNKVAVTLQRCLVLLGENKHSFGINIDEVVDILHSDEKQIHSSQEEEHMGDFISVAGVLEHKGKLITIIKDVTINKRSA
ncbi:MAG: chemotaxis protein CheW [Campylobacterales bacterium]|nr:chemotaxis protein CheW [Campylobacterales bacterium]MBE0499522.1 chemotaxis protein CheW [Campylobacterales bacterium]